MQQDEEIRYHFLKKVLDFFLQKVVLLPICLSDFSTLYKRTKEIEQKVTDAIETVRRTELG